jgi:tripartite-type tricarboxylate transporter receptor subunit TctC
VPAATPEDIITLLHNKIVEFVAQPDMKERLEALDFYPVESTPSEFAERIKVELNNWRQVIQAAHIKAE